MSRLESHEENHIVQIIPADGWYAEFKLKDNSKISVPLVAWGVTRGGFVVPLETDEESGYVMNATESNNFHRVYKDD